MQKTISTICSSVFMVFAFLAPGYADEHFPFLAVVSKGSVNVRAGPNTNFEKIDKLNKGAQVVVLGRTYEWYKVQPLATTKAFIRSDYLNIQKGGPFALVQGDNVNVRSSASSNAASLGEVKKGTLVKVLGQENGWSGLAPVAGTTAWINQDFLTEVSSDVPGSLLIQKIEKASSDTPENPVKVAPSAVSPWVSMRGKVEALVASVRSDVHYEIVMDDKSVFLLKDIPHLSDFCNAVVDLEGAVIPDPQKNLMYPLLQINKISLVL